MLSRVLCSAVAATLLAAAGCGDSEGTMQPIVPRDGGDRPPPPPGGPSGRSCTEDSQCTGGTCVGDANGPETGNPRFHGGYCTTLGCEAESQNGCGPDEWCSDLGFSTMCLEMCSKAAGMECDRPDHVCIGLGAWGGCMSEQAVECNSDESTGCGTDEICVRIGFDDRRLGRCETLCDPMHDVTCGDGHACYYVRRYDDAFCGTPGATAPEAICSCDKCCVEGWACTPDLDGAGKHCKEYCLVSEGCDEGACVPLETGSPWGGCVAPGSAGT
jgi:hypothetical protein